MPLYEYRCEHCQHQFERIQKFSDDPVSVCPSCNGGPVVKLLSSPAIQFKGSGWYITDYAKKGTAAETSSSTPPSADSKTKSPSSDSPSSAATSTPAKTD